jgi:hypothetical protein
MKGQTMMKYSAMIGAVMTVLMLGAGTASAADWSYSWTGPRGATGTRDVHCAYRGCRYTSSGIGPQGQAWSRSGGVYHGPYRNYGYRAFTGPAGNTYVTRRAWPRH